MSAPEPTPLLRVDGTAALEGKVLDAASPEAVVRVARVEALQVIAAPLPVIRTAEDYTAAGARFASYKAKIAALEARRVKITKPINDGLKATNELFREAKEIWERAIAREEIPMKGYIKEQDEIRASAQRAAQEEAARLRREQEAAQAVALAEVEKAQEAARVAQEAAANTNPFLRAAATARAAAADAEALKVRVEAEESIRESRRAQAVASAPTGPVARAAGTKVNRPWLWEYTDKSLIPRSHLIENEQLINATVKSCKGDTNIPGIRVYQDIAIGGR